MMDRTYKVKNIENVISSKKDEKKRYYRKNYNFFELLKKIKLWPSRKGILHGIKSITVIGNKAEITTHCNEKFMIRNSKNSRASRWLRNKWLVKVCPRCKIPQWKLEKYASTIITQDYGAKF
ncbi:pyrrolysine--tRNA(Pyl) ligase small subunit [Carboxydothermus ferrireducens]|uniref:Pyrrolysyl-tRNA synthetase-like protein n=2 Tax=Carboxydothermus TaxID=129957 RepID=A0ABX2RBF2_9THEO|nr:pyrrolysine--tRNA(Pyl) ligase small subunit [Carboxydothermus ferrireducens]NYE58501.1 pyrrolysyl-tRNA synthetase-like protein [Carboxydothermus ferrireducens DSM 11255]